MAFSYKRFPAALERTLERTIVGVRPHVGLKITRLGEVLHTVREATKQQFICGRGAS